MYFDCAQLLSYTHTPKFFGGSDFRYAIEKKFAVEGLLTDWDNTSGISGVIAKQHLLISGANDYEPIYLNNILFGSGKIDSIKLAEDNLVREDAYVFDITCVETGSLWNYLSGYLSGINFDSNTYLIDSFDEKLSWEKGEDGVQTYNHNIQVLYNRQFPALTGINLGKIFAQNLFNSTQGLFPFLGQYQNLGNYKRLYAETYNLITRGCGFSAIARILPNETAGYSYTLDYNLQLNEDGYTDITENCDIQGVYTPRAAYAESGFNALLPNVLTRISGVYTGYAFSTLPLYSQPLVKNITTNKFEGKKSFSHSFTNNPKYKNTAIWEYQNEINKDANGYITSSENGTVKGLGRPLLDKYQNAYNFYTGTVLTGIDFRIGTYYSGFTTNPHSLITIHQDFGRDEFKGEITYGREATDNNLFINASGIKKSEIEISIRNPVHLVQAFNVFNYKELIQSQNTVTQGEVGITVKLRGKRTNTRQNYFDFAGPIVSGYINYGTDTYLEDINYQMNPLNTDFNINAVFKFNSGYKTLGDLQLS